MTGREEGPLEVLRGRLAQLERELAQAHARQAATANVLRILSGMMESAQPVFDEIARSCSKLFPESGIGVWLVRDGALVSPSRNSTVDSDTPASTWQDSLPLDRESTVGAAVLDSRLINIPELSQKVAEFPTLAKIAIPRGRRSAVVAPLLREGAAIGAIMVTRNQSGAFSDREVDLLQTFAAQAVIAIENVRLFNETREALERQTATAEVLRVISRSPSDLAPAFEAIATSGSGLFERSSVTLRLLEGDRLRAAAIAFSSDWEGSRAPVMDDGLRVDRATPAGRAVLTGEVVHLPDLAADGALGAEFRQIAGRRGYHSILVAPMVRDGKAVGTIAVSRVAVGAFNAKQIALLQTFADQAVIAIENVRLFNEIQEKSRQLAEWNRTLEARVEEGVAQLERAKQLQRFLSPQLAELVLSGGGQDQLLAHHRREITVVFLDLRGFTAFTETSEPEEVMRVLNEYHAAMGTIIQAHGGTLDGYAGDGIMVFFNDPIPIPDAPARAARMALEMQRAFALARDAWAQRGYRLDLGIGIAQGYATLGIIGFEGRWDYGAIGTVCNLAARLCAEAQGGETLVSQRVVAGLGGEIGVESAGELALKGFARPVTAFRLAPARPA